LSVVERHRNAQLGVIAEERWRGDRLVAQPLASIGGVCDQLAQKYRFIGVDRVHHQVQKLGDVRLERTAFRLRALGCFGVSHGYYPRQVYNWPVSRWQDNAGDSSPTCPWRGRGLPGSLRVSVAPPELSSHDLQSAGLENAMRRRELIASLGTIL